MKKVKEILKKIWLFLKNWGLYLINLIVVIIAYDYKSDSVFIGLWLFFLLAYFLFWKLLGGEKMFKNRHERSR